MPFLTPGNRHGRAFPQVPSDSRPLRNATRRRRASSTICEFVADERGKFSGAQSLENSENAERFSLRESLIRFPCRAPSRACPEMAPQRLEKIKSAPENGMVSEASKPQHLVYGRAAHRALRRNSLGPPPMARRPQFTNSKRRKADGKFSASQPLGIAQNRKIISEALTAQRPRSTKSTREKAARKIVAEKGA